MQRLQFFDFVALKLLKNSSDLRQISQVQISSENILLFVMLLKAECEPKGKKKKGEGPF